MRTFLGARKHMAEWQAGVPHFKKEEPSSAFLPHYFTQVTRILTFASPHTNSAHTSTIAMAASPLQAFDPHATHYFTSHGSLPKTFYASPYGGTNTFPASSSLPTQQTPSANTVKAPQPRTPAQLHQQQPVFTQFTKDRASPDLPDIKFKKRTACAWDSIPAPVSASAPAPASSSSGQR